MKNRLIEIYWLKEYENIRKIPKNTFYKEDDFNKTYEKLFTKDVDSIHIISALNKNIINISTFKNDDYNYSEIYYIFVSLKSKTKIEDIIKIIHNIVPNPCVITLQYNENIYISTATKRINKNDKTKQVIEEYFDTSKLDLDYLSEIEKEFLEDINIKNNSFENFKRFYLDISNKIFIFNIQELRWGYKKTSVENIDMLINKFKNYKKIKNELITIESNFKEEITMWAEAILHTQIVEKKKELEKIIKEIKEV